VFRSPSPLPLLPPVQFRVSAFQFAQSEIRNPKSKIPPSLLNKSVNEDRLFHVQIFSAPEADGDGAVEQIKAPMPLGLARVAAQLPAKRASVQLAFPNN
jgi:hypothetical protein